MNAKVFKKALVCLTLAIPFATSSSYCSSENMNPTCNSGEIKKSTTNIKKEEKEPVVNLTIMLDKNKIDNDINIDDKENKNVSEENNIESETGKLINNVKNTDSNIKKDIENDKTETISENYIQEKDEEEDEKEDEKECNINNINNNYINENNNQNKNDENNIKKSIVVKEVKNKNEKQLTSNLFKLSKQNDFYFGKTSNEKENVQAILIDQCINDVLKQQALQIGNGTNDFFYDKKKQQALFAKSIDSPFEIAYNLSSDDIKQKIQTLGLHELVQHSQKIKEVLDILYKNINVLMRGAALFNSTHNLMPSNETEQNQMFDTCYTTFDQWRQSLLRSCGVSLDLIGKRYWKMIAKDHKSTSDKYKKVEEMKQILLQKNEQVRYIYCCTLRDYTELMLKWYNFINTFLRTVQNSMQMLQAGNCSVQKNISILERAVLSCKSRLDKLALDLVAIDYRKLEDEIYQLRSFFIFYQIVQQCITQLPKNIKASPFDDMYSSIMETDDSVNKNWFPK